ncbi:helix-turn-helix transcriptional regulator [Pseudaminobacter sp. 19-2017]|uniref:Helix-turn-helix transcriptional regulator n=1 Tax=Pseudaminobacter soli (ex Zhang et al. 2022) TaxID=2831468 RepID=A0A942E3U5_9HYPH|nr:helix-turn-helix domain-containing protein [Pseudaminobacter soli]MBS3650605.1 helix-turn-helix transcriptional regulator [Pseudaminobacter soli]
MEERGGYGQFCPVAMAAEVLCTRWTILIVRELLCGSRRFNDLRRGVPRMSPALLSKRLKELEKAGVIAAVPGESGNVEYALSSAGEELKPLIETMGMWGHRWVESRLSLKNLDPSLLMWDIRRRLDPRPLPDGRCTIQFQYPELPEPQRNWWLVIENGEVDLCGFDPGYEINLLVRSSLHTMTAVWMGLLKIPNEVAAGNLRLEGERPVASAIQKWLGFSSFAGEQRRVA